MSEDRDPQLQALFAAANEELDEAAFRERVMAATGRLKLRILSGAGVIAILCLLLAALFSVPLIELAFLITEFLSTELIPIAESNLAWILAPVNNVGAAVVVFLRLLRVGFNRARDAAYVN